MRKKKKLCKKSYQIYGKRSTELEIENEEKKAENKIPSLWKNPDLPKLALIVFNGSIVSFL